MASSVKVKAALPKSADEKLLPEAWHSSFFIPLVISIFSQKSTGICKKCLKQRRNENTSVILAMFLWRVDGRNHAECLLFFCFRFGPYSWCSVHCIIHILKRLHFKEYSLQVACVGRHPGGGLRALCRSDVWLHDRTGHGRNDRNTRNRSSRRGHAVSIVPLAWRVSLPF